MNVFRIAVILLTMGALAVQAAEPDLSTPQTALKSFQDAVAATDAEAVLKTMWAENDGEQKLARAFANVLVAGKKLNDAAKAKFGTTGQSVGTAAAAGELLGGLDKAPVVINGDSAAVGSTTQPSGRVVHLKKSAAGQWQVVVRDFANPGDSDIATQAEVLEKVAAVFSDVAGQIEADKFGGPQDAEGVIQSRLANVLIGASRRAAMKAEATQPSTRPGAR